MIDQQTGAARVVSARCEVRVLGGIELIGPGGPVDLPDDVRVLLGLLALRPGRPVSAGALADAVHPAAVRPAATRSDAVHPDAMRSDAVRPDGVRSDASGPAVRPLGDLLRDLVAGFAACGRPDAIRCEADGYLLRLAGRRIDTVRFGHLLRLARDRMAAGELARAGSLFTVALRLWSPDRPGPDRPGPDRPGLDRPGLDRPGPDRPGPERPVSGVGTAFDGDPLAGCPLNPSGWAAAEVDRLIRSRIAAVEERWECGLRLAAAAYSAAGGPSADRTVVAAGMTAIQSAAVAVADLRAAVRRHPLRVRLWELLLVAAFLAHGRSAAAEVERRAHRAFEGRLDAGPGERLRELAGYARRGDLADRWMPAPEQAGPPPSRSARSGARPDARPGSDRAALPVPMTTLLGREDLLAVVLGILNTRRLVTLTGPGGAGKTRLAVAVAHRYAAPAVWFVDLGPVESPVRVARAVAAALGVPAADGREPPDELVDGLGEEPEPPDELVDGLGGGSGPPDALVDRLGEGSEPPGALVDRLGGGPALLVLDNCEHLLPGCRQLVGRLLACCPRLRILATSRVALRLPAEAVVPVPPLASPAPGTGHTIAGLAAHPATRLFLERSRAHAGRPVPESSADDVARLCAELDGLPLAIELAAARTSLLSVREIIARIRADLRLLTSPDPTAPSRHRTLTAAVESSIARLDEPVRTLLDRLAVFQGGFHADAAEAMCGPAARGALADLVEASLVAPDCDAGRDLRYRMLAPIRRCALARLAAGGAEASARRDHARYVLRLAEQADARLRDAAAAERWLRRLRAEVGNLRAAMAWLAGDPGDRYGELRLAAALARYCRLDGRYREGLDWLATALARRPDAPAGLRARAGSEAATLALLLDDLPAAAPGTVEPVQASTAAGSAMQAVPTRRKPALR